MDFHHQNKNNKKKAATNTDPLFLLAELLMKIDQREKVIPTSEDSIAGDKT